MIEFEHRAATSCAIYLRSAVEGAGGIKDEAGIGGVAVGVVATDRAHSGSILREPEEAPCIVIATSITALLSWQIQASEGIKNSSPGMA